jgi:predicted O-linked N-acetylglucosamine transferase (SPINDLY family)
MENPSAGAKRSASRPIRIGFISKYFYEHPIGKYYAGVIRHLSRERFRVIVLDFGDGADDAVARLIWQSADARVTLSSRLEVARQQIAEQQLDVLFYPDIGMDALTYCLAFARLAPVQCVSVGHPVTTGIPTIDYFISGADLEPPDAGRHYSERLVVMKGFPNYFERPKLSSPPKERRDFCLEEGAHWYVCAQTLFKVHPEFDEIVGGILQADPAGRVLFFHGTHPHWTELLLARFRRTIPGGVDRIEFIQQLPNDAFLHLLRVADVLLDTLHFGGGTTSLQAFAAGTPVVTLPGTFMRGRATCACYRKMGVLDCVAQDKADYVRLAVRLATEPAWRDHVQARIQAAQQVLFDNPEFVRELEQLLIQAVH